MELSFEDENREQAELENEEEELFPESEPTRPHGDVNEELVPGHEAAGRELDDDEVPEDDSSERIEPRATSPRPIAAREYYSISEVCDLVGLKPHVLRYWETQFPLLNPSKNRSGNRVYQRKEIKLILLVKHLLYKEKYTIDGAKQRLEQLRKGGELGAETSRALDAQMVEMLRAELQQIAAFLTLEPA